MKPNKNTIFLPISKLVEYQNKSQFYCCAVVFSPETENDHFEGCPPYIEIGFIKEDRNSLFFQIPEIVAYYAKTHPCYTMKGIEQHKLQGERNLANKIKKLLEIE